MQRDDEPFQLDRDRKSVVEGKRGELGGGRMIKKKKKKIEMEEEFSQEQHTHPTLRVRTSGVQFGAQHEQATAYHCVKWLHTGP